MINRAKEGIYSPVRLFFYHLKLLPYSIIKIIKILKGVPSSKPKYFL